MVLFHLQTYIPSCNLISPSELFWFHCSLLRRRKVRDFFFLRSPGAQNIMRRAVKIEPYYPNWWKSHDRICAARTQPIKVLWWQKETSNGARAEIFSSHFSWGIFPRPARIELRSEVVAINQRASLLPAWRTAPGIGLIMQPVWHVGRKQTAAGAFVTWHATTQSTNSVFAIEVAAMEINWLRDTERRRGDAKVNSNYIIAKLLRAVKKRLSFCGDAGALFCV